MLSQCVTLTTTSKLKHRQGCKVIEIHSTCIIKASAVAYSIAITYNDVMTFFTFSYITSTVKRAHILLLRASITPLRMVSPSPLIKSAISKKMPLSSQIICRRTMSTHLNHNYMTLQKQATTASNNYLHKHLTRSVKILNNDWTCHRLRANIKGPGCTTFKVVFPYGTVLTAKYLCEYFTT